MRLLISALLAACLLCGPGAHGAVDVTHWSHVVEITLPEAPATGVVEIPLSPEVFDHASAHLADLRLLTAEGAEVGYVLRTTGGTGRTASHDARLYNRAYVPGISSTVTADFGQRYPKSSIDITTAGTNFRRRVLVEASDDGARWRTIRENAFLFRIHNDEGAQFDSNTVTLPENDQRYLRVTILHGQDDGRRLDIERVTGWRAESTPAETTTVPIVQRAVHTEKAVTSITLDTGYRHLPLHEVTLDFAEANFFRHAVIYGRNALQRTVSIPREDAPPREKTVKEPWEPITSGMLYRFSAGASQSESLTLLLGSARYRYLKIEIHNADDPPLQLTDARLTRLQTYLLFPARGATRYRMYLGNPDATSPTYDLPHYVTTLRDEGVTRAVGTVTANPRFRRAAPLLPWSERHQVILWAALLAVFALLARIVSRQVRVARDLAASESSGEEAPPPPPGESSH